MKHDAEGRTDATDGPPRALMRAIDELHDALGRPDASEADRLARLAKLKAGVELLAAEAARLRRLNTAMERDNAQLNAAMLALALDPPEAPEPEIVAPQPEPAPPVPEPEPPQAAAPEPVAAEVVAAVEDAPPPEEPKPEAAFGELDGESVFSCRLAGGAAQVVLGRRLSGDPAPRAIVPAGVAGAMAGSGDFVLALHPFDESSGAKRVDWTGERRAAFAGALAQISEAALAGTQAGGLAMAEAETWTAVAAYLEAVAARMRSPARDGVVVGPFAVDGVGPVEQLPGPEGATTTVRWTTRDVARFEIFVTRKGRLTLALALRSLAPDQSAIVRLDGVVLVDANLPLDADERAAPFEVEADVDWGPHVVEIEASAFVREQGGAFRSLHLLVEDFVARWSEAEDEEVEEDDLFDWAPPLFDEAASHDDASGIG